MLDKIKRQSFYVILVEVLIILFIIIGVTYALYTYGNNFRIKTVSIGIDTSIYGDTYIDSNDIKLVPIKDKDVSSNDSNVLKINFNVRGNKNNVVNNIIYDIALANLDIDCDLLSKYLKWELLRNGEVISSGSFSSDFDTIIDNRLVLTNEPLDLVDYSREADHFEYRMWLSDSCQEDDIKMCIGNADQANLLNKSISGRIEVELYTGEAVKLERKPGGLSSCTRNLDTSGANKPILDKNMLAVYYDNNNWKLADSKNTNSSYKWYDYGNSMWANSVIVKDISKYVEIDLGSVVSNDDILGFYVWIPRYKYQVWNMEYDTSLVDKYKNGINISFEKGINDSGEISCSDSCVGNNLEWLLHPSFSSLNAKGFWISKYQTRGSKKRPLVVSDGDILLNYSMENALNTSLNILDYGINDFKLDILNNLEWGSVIYLMYSNYGICSNYSCNIDTDSSTDNIYGIYDVYNNELLRESKHILGDASLEMGYSYDIDGNYLFRSNLLDISSKINNYGFRNILYK